jgi:predicted unusual protein kinase regulating ubiquinone biosynthesis (AarF/ABC1/UbiB family)
MCSLHQYDTQQMRDEVLASPLDYLRVGGRALYIVGTLGWYGFTLVLDGFFSRDDPQTVQQRASQAREILIKLGPTFIKAGQVLANRPDIIRMDYMQELTLLQDNVPAFPNAEAMAIMEQQIGAPLDTVFSYVSTDPIAAASLGQVYKAKLKTGEDVAIKVQRPGIEPIIKADLCIFRSLAYYINPISQRRLGTSAELIVDEFGEKMLEELDYNLEARSMEMFGKNFADDPTVKIPWVRRDLSGSKMITMEWIDGVRCTDPQAIFDSGLDVDRFISVGVVSGLRQLLEFGLFHGDPHPGNLFAMRDGRIAYVDFGNVAEISQTNKQILIDAVVHAVNEDYEAMAGDFIQLGFLARGTDVGPIVPALEQIWQNSMGQSMRDFNFRSVTARFNELVYQYPIRVPERYALVIRSLLTQEGICMTLDPDFHFLEVAYPYVARRLLTDESPALRERLLQVLFRDDKFQWERLENLIRLSREGPAGNFDFTDTIKYGLQLLLRDDDLRAKLVMALSEGDRLRIEESLRIADLLRDDIDFNRLAQEAGQGVNDVLVDFPAFGRRALIGWAERTLAA